MTYEEIQNIAVAHGFKLKQQKDGSTSLNPYVFDFANALLATHQPEIDALRNELSLRAHGEKRAHQRVEMLNKDVAALKAEVERLRKDAERLGYCIKYGFPVLYQTGWRAPYPSGNLTGQRFSNAIDAIDNAMKETK